MIRTFSMKSTNGKNNLHGVIWEPESNPKREPIAILQIAHGMNEYIERYDDFARYMAKNGVLVIGNDHIGHGSTVDSIEELGYFSKKNGSSHIVNDVFQVTKFVKCKYPHTPYILLGHSMGSFIVRKYLMEFEEELNGVIIMGTGNQPLSAIIGGKVLVKMLTMLKSELYRSPFIQRMMFRDFNRKIENPRTHSDWITSDHEIVVKYNQDPKCAYIFTLNGFYNLLDIIHYIQKSSNINKMPKDLPILLTSGQDDPVGDYGNSVKELQEKLIKAGIQHVDLKLYENCRHEILNELNREHVYEDILRWILKMCNIPNTSSL